MDIVKAVHDWSDPRWEEPTTLQLASFGLAMIHGMGGHYDLRTKLLNAACFCRAVSVLPDTCVAYRADGRTRRRVDALVKSARRRLCAVLREIYATYDCNDRNFLRLTWWHAKDDAYAVSHGNFREDLEDLRTVHEAVRTKWTSE